MDPFCAKVGGAPLFEDVFIFTCFHFSVRFVGRCENLGRPQKNQHFTTLGLDKTRGLPSASRNPFQELFLRGGGERKPFPNLILESNPKVLPVLNLKKKLYPASLMPKQMPKAVYKTPQPNIQCTTKILV